MALNLVGKYIWIINTIKRRRRVTFGELNKLWSESPMGEGTTMSRRTFYNYRNGILDTFNIEIAYDMSTFEYYIEVDGGEAEAHMQQWLLDSMALNGMIRESHDVSSRILLEDVPSSRHNLPTFIDAMRENKRVKFDYQTYKRVRPTTDVVIEPYFVKVFNQIWYVIGYNVADKRIKTYALDRMKNVTITDKKFKMPEGFVPTEFFANSYGITTSSDEPKRIRLRVESVQARYFRELPLHSSQTEEIHDQYSIFEYRMYNTYDLRQRLLSHGSAIEVLEPTELRVAIIEELKASLALYGENKE